MHEFIICRNLIIEEYAFVNGESLAEVEAKWHTGLLDASFELGETQQTGEVLIYPVPSDPNELHPSAPDLREVTSLKEQVRILREALSGLCDSQLTSRDREDAITRGLAALEATKEDE